MSSKAAGEMLVAAPGRWEEACFAIPALRALAASGIKVGVLCAEEQRGLWTTLPGIAIAGVPPKAKARAVAAEIAGKWQASMVWEAGLEAEIFHRAGIPRRIGPEEKSLRKWLTHPVAVTATPGPVRHRVEFYLDLVSKLGIETAKAAFFSPVDPPAPPQSDTVLLSPDSDFGANHEWPLDRWVAIAGKLAENRLKLTVAGIPGGRDLGKSLAAELGADTGFFDAYPLPAALPLFSAHAAVIAADSSLPHLASHAGSTCVTLFGPNDPNWKRPLGRRHRVIRRHVPCAPCLMSECPLDLRCQRDLPPEMVLEFLLGK